MCLIPLIYKNIPKNSKNWKYLIKIVLKIVNLQNKQIEISFQKSVQQILSYFGDVLRLVCVCLHFGALHKNSHFMSIQIPTIILYIFLYPFIH